MQRAVLSTDTRVMHELHHSMYRFRVLPLGKFFLSVKPLLHPCGEGGSKHIFSRGENEGTKSEKLLNCTPYAVSDSFLNVLVTK